MLTLKQTADYLNISVRTLQRWIKEDNCPPYVSQGRRKLFDKSQIDRWAEEENHLKSSTSSRALSSLILGFLNQPGIDTRVSKYDWDKLEYIRKLVIKEANIDYILVVEIHNTTDPDWINLHFNMMFLKPGYENPIIQTRQARLNWNSILLKVYESCSQGGSVQENNMIIIQGLNEHFEKLEDINQSILYGKDSFFNSYNTLLVKG